jgi:hypothetical protein
MVMVVEGREVRSVLEAGLVGLFRKCGCSGLRCRRQGWPVILIFIFFLTIFKNKKKSKLHALVGDHSLYVLCRLAVFLYIDYGNFGI